MQKEDLPEILDMEGQLFPQPWNEEMYIHEMDLHDAFVIRKAEESEILGFMCGWTVLDEYNITNVGINPKFQKHGIAYRALSRLIEIKRATGIAFFYLEVRESNIPAISLYLKLGFKKMGLRKNYYRNPIEHGILMGLID